MLKKLSKKFVENLGEIYSKEDLKILEEGFNVGKRKTTFRVNTLIGNVEEVLENLKNDGLVIKKVNFLENCYSLENGIESDLWKTSTYKTGRIYVQSISSQIPVSFFSSSDEKLTILDATAAPGGKTSQLSARFPNSKIYAFEKNQLRFEKLNHNLKKLKVKNVDTVKSDIRKILDFIGSETYFDYILIDAPCSGEGSINLEKEKTYSLWDEFTNRKYYRIQKSIISSSLPYLKDSGEFIYSTCSISPEENENVVHFILSNFPELELVELDFSYEYSRSGVLKYKKQFYNKTVCKTIRIVPNEESEGFFVAKFRKNSQ